MISPELLRRYPFFGFLSDVQQKDVAMISKEITVPKDTILFRKGDKADSLYILIEGAVDLYETALLENDPTYHREYLVNEIGQGEVVGLPSLIEPHVIYLTAKVTSPSRLIKIDVVELRKLCDADLKLAYNLMSEAAKLALKRLEATRSLLAMVMNP